MGIIFYGDNIDWLEINSQAVYLKDLYNQWPEYLGILSNK